MSTWTLTEATELFEAAKAAYKRVLLAKEYTLKDRELKRIELKEAAQEMNRWKGLMADLSAGNSGQIKARRIVI